MVLINFLSSLCTFAVDRKRWRQSHTELLHRLRRLSQNQPRAACLVLIKQRLVSVHGYTRSQWKKLDLKSHKGTNLLEFQLEVPF